LAVWDQKATLPSISPQPCIFYCSAPVRTSSRYALLNVLPCQVVAGIIWWPHASSFLAFWPLLAVWDQKSALPSISPQPYIVYCSAHMRTSSCCALPNVLPCQVVAGIIRWPHASIFLAFWPLLAVCDKKAALPSISPQPYIVYCSAPVKTLSCYALLNVLPCQVVAGIIRCRRASSFIAFWPLLAIWDQKAAWPSISPQPFIFYCSAPVKTLSCYALLNVLPCQVVAGIIRCRRASSFIAFWPLLAIWDQKAAWPSISPQPFIFYCSAPVKTSSSYALLNVSPCQVLAGIIRWPHASSFHSFCGHFWPFATKKPPCLPYLPNLLLSTVQLL
jgi:hypothetical protein